MMIRKMGIAPRAAVGFGLIGLIVLLLGLLSLSRISEMRAQSDEVDQNWLPGIVTLGELNADMLRVRAMTMRMVIAQDRAQLEADRSAIAKLMEAVLVLDREYQPQLTGADQKAAYQRFTTARGAYFAIQQRIVELMIGGRRDEAIELFNGGIMQHADDMTAALTELMTISRQGARGAASEALVVYESAFAWVVFTIVLAAVATVLLALLFTRSITQPLRQALQVAETVAAGDLSQDFVVDGNDEPARLLAALKNMQARLRSTVRDISDSSRQLASAAEELSSVTEESSRGLHQQNQEVEQAATAVNQMTAAVDEVANNAVATSEASRESDASAQHGRTQVRETVISIELLASDVTTTASQVEQLAGQVRDISKVLDVIRSIAEQTNLLALNAAIEAARAGDAGRGFAVVADEVRALAHRTQQSTEEIEQMISDVHQGTDRAVSAMQTSNERARSTLTLARTAGDALDTIVGAISQISERNLVIASASEQQAQVAREVDRNLVNIRDLSMQSSVGASQTNVASQELARLAADLNGLVASFRT